MSDLYREFLEAKITFSPTKGFEVEDHEVSQVLRPDQRAVVRWAVAGGCRAIFASFGLGKTLDQIEILRLIQKRVGGDVLIVLPLGVRQEFTRDMAKLGMVWKFIRSADEMDLDHRFYLTNYETIRDGKIEPGAVHGFASLDEADVPARALVAPRPTATFLPLFEQRALSLRGLTATATSSPNRIQGANRTTPRFLGVMDTGQALTTLLPAQLAKKAGDAHPAIRTRSASSGCGSHQLGDLLVRSPPTWASRDEGYELPPHGPCGGTRCRADHQRRRASDRDGQVASWCANASMPAMADAAREKRDYAYPARIAKLARDARDQSEPQNHFGCSGTTSRHEREAIEAALPSGRGRCMGAQDLDDAGGRSSSPSRPAS